MDLLQPDRGDRPRRAHTGRFRIGGDQPVLDADGPSRISVEDSAIAVLDEAELPGFVERRFTIVVAGGDRTVWMWDAWRLAVK